MQKRKTAKTTLSLALAIMMMMSWTTAAMAASNEGGTPPTDEIVEEIVDEIVDEVEDDSQATAQKDTSSSLQNTNRKAIIYSVICLAIFGVILYGSNKKNPSPKRKKSKE